MRSLIYGSMALLVAFTLGCSSSNGPVTSPNITQPSSPELTSTAEGVGPSAGHTILWGYWDVTMNPETGLIEIVPIRGAQWTVDVTMFLQPPKGSTINLKIAFGDTSEWLTLGHLPVFVTLVHPFPGMDQFTGADVRGLFISTAEANFNHDSDLAYSDGGEVDPFLANADGYTRWMNPVEFPDDGSLWTNTPGALGMGSGFNATLNGYKYFCFGIEDDQDLYDFFTNPGDLANRGQFRSSNQVTREYDLWFPLSGPGGTPDLRYQYAVIASWEPPVDLDPSDLPGSFPPDANTREAFLAHAVDAGGTLYYTPGDAGGDLRLDIEIFDWAPYLGASGSVLDEINRVIIESPQGILPSPYVAFDNATLAATAVAGTTDASSIVSIEIAGCTPNAVEGQEVWIAVEHSGGLTYDNYGYGTDYPDKPLTGYFLHTLDVSNVVPQTDKPVVTSIVPDHGIPDTHLYDVVVNGENFDGVTELNLVGDSTQCEAVNMVVVDSTLIECELVLDGMELGLYDVVAHDPDLGDGVLEDGFEVMDCPSGIPDQLDLYDTNVAYDPLFVAGVFTSGQYAGQIITQQGAFAWNRIDVTDPPANPTTVAFYANKPSLSGMYTDWSWSLDCDPVNEIFAFTTFDDDDDSGSWPDTEFDFVKICNQQDGSYVGACDTNCGYAVGQVDVDEYGNVWAVCSNAYYPNMSWTLQRWDYDPDAPAPHYTKVGDWDISGYIAGDRVISDIVVLQRYRRLYISGSNGWSPWGVRIHCWDFSVDPPVHVNDVLTTQTGFYGTDSYQEVHQRFVDMEVDRTDDVLAACRIMVMFMGQPASQRTLELRKFDLDLNLLNQSSMEFYWAWSVPPYNYTGWFSNFVLDDEHGGRVVAPYDRFNNPSSTGIVGVTNKASDW